MTLTWVEVHSVAGFMLEQFSGPGEYADGIAAYACMQMAATKQSHD